MHRLTNDRMKWGLCALLAGTLLGGGVLVSCGVAIGGDVVRVGLTSGSRVGEVAGPSCGYASIGGKVVGCGWTNRTLYKGFFCVWISHLDDLGNWRAAPVKHGHFLAK